MRTATPSPRTRLPTEAAVDRALHEIKAGAESEEPVDSDYVARVTGRLFEATGGNPGAAVEALLLRCHRSQQQVEELVGVVRGLKEEKPALAWVVSRDFALRPGAQGPKYVYVLGSGDGAGGTQCFQRLAPEVLGEAPAEPLPEPPFVGLVEPTTRTFLEPATHIPAPPVPAEVLEVVASQPEGPYPGLGELEVKDSAGDRRFTLLTSRTLAREVRKKIVDDAESVQVRAEGRVATSIYQSDVKAREPWLMFLPEEGPRVSDLVFPRQLSEAWEGDILDLATGYTVEVILIGPTGTGKTAAAERVARDAFFRAKTVPGGRSLRGMCLLNLTSGTIGSSFIHQTEVNMDRAFRRAEQLTRANYLVVVILDEGDALLGEAPDMGGEHSHNRTERLTAQNLLNRPLAGVGVYLTMNHRRGSSLPAAIQRRFQERPYPRTTRGQIAAVANAWADESPEAVAKAGIGRPEFGQVFADQLFADRRVVAVARLHSGREVPVRARDLQICSPGKVRSILDRWARNVRRGTHRSMEDLWKALDEDFRGASLSARNLHELTFIKPWADDTLRSLEFVA